VIGQSRLRTFLVIGENTPRCAGTHRNRAWLLMLKLAPLKTIGTEIRFVLDGKGELGRPVSPEAVRVCGKCFHCH